MVKIEIDTRQLEKAIEQLPLKEKANLIEKIQRKTWQEDFRKLVSEIRARFKRNPIPSKELNRMIEQARKEYHARCGH